MSKTKTQRFIGVLGVKFALMDAVVRRAETQVKDSASLL